MHKSILIALYFILIHSFQLYSWGFYGHKQINRLAVFTLPPEMMPFYKLHIDYIAENSVNPDKRRYVVKEEAARHFIDIDSYGDSAFQKLPHYWNKALEKYPEDTLQAHGIVPWHINKMKYLLTDAFKRKDVSAILKLSAEIGHYIADANVPLHTTENYNGQLTNQHGIHGFWESRLPELFAEEYDFFVGKADYLSSPQLTAWNAIEHAHMALDSVLNFEKALSSNYSEDKKYSYEERGNLVVKVYSKQYASDYHQMLHGQVESRMRASIKMTGDFWYTCWVDAGQPDLRSLMDGKFVEPEDEKQELNAAKEIENLKSNMKGHED